ncbi:glycosyltransferase family 2 protein [Candidatus Bathyarchaeota archaeon]|nr:glycosyltransferase family 2 protein [Candidatus Bathyarchaeota archaeon]
MPTIHTYQFGMRGPTIAERSPVPIRRDHSAVMLMIPTLNEEEAVGPLLQESAAIFPRAVVVDGHSHDRTREIAQSFGVNVLLQEFGPGKGCGVRTGMRFFLSSDAEILCIIDGDGTNIPGDLAGLVELVRNGEADIAIGSRTKGERDPGSMSFITIASNRVVSYLLSLRYGGSFTDIQTGYWALGRSAVQRLLPCLRSTRFEIELEIFSKAKTAGLVLKEVPVGFRRRVGHTKFSFSLRMRNLYYAFKYILSLRPPG